MSELKLRPPVPLPYLGILARPALQTAMSWHPSLRGRYGGADAFAEDGAANVAGLVHVEDHDGHAVVHAQRDGGRIHDFQILVQDLAIGNLRKKFGVADFFGIGVVDAVDARGFEDDVGFNFHGAECGGGVGGKVGIAGAGGEDDNAAFFEMAHGAAANEGFADLMHLDGALHASMDLSFFERVLQSKGVEDGGEHAHVIAGGAVDFKAFLAGAPEDISSANHDGDLHAEFIYFAKFFGDGVDGAAVDAEALRTLQRFAGEFEENAVVGRSWFAAFADGFCFRGHDAPMKIGKTFGIVTNSGRGWRIERMDPAISGEVVVEVLRAT